MFFWGFGAHTRPQRKADVNRRCDIVGSLEAKQMKGQGTSTLPTWTHRGERILGLPPDSHGRG